ncbi:unnamed protein product [Adineta steineri]|uniref:Uncharacterized protein n=1 Tax=Adineta steineri TaxID=433720 RepID=A0A813TF97_9BILA|nr:unnamed protein product [Adineta steineri]CAF0808260.1 unnamed protein product [Adineta steineri]CAF4147126.1 unnamed protein product [Adineta steineri]CAF4148787.1 unnamed protein product [Adineta steineri]
MQGYKSVLFEIEINSDIPSSPFASIQEWSQFPEEDEILFSTHTVFHIDRVVVENDGLYRVNLSLTNNYDRNLRELMAHRRKEIVGRTSIHRLALLLYRMGKFDIAEKIYRQLLGEVDALDEILYINHYLARISCQMGQFGKALSMQSTCFQFMTKHNRALVADVYAGMAEAFVRQDMLEDSLELYERAFQIAEQSQTISDHSKVLYLNNIGCVLKLQKRYNQAKNYFQKALDIALARFPSTHPDIADLYQNIGSLYFDMGDFHASIDYLTKSLAIQQSSLPADHPALGNTHYNLSKTFIELHQIYDAIHHGQLAVDILKKTLSDIHFDVREAQAQLDAISLLQR